MSEFAFKYHRHRQVSDRTGILILLQGVRLRPRLVVVEWLSSGIWK